MSPQTGGVRVPGSFSLRPSTSHDRDFLISLYVAGRESELPYLGETLIRMQYDIRLAQYLQRFPRTAPEIIMVSDQGVGSVWIAELPAEVCLVDLGLIAEYRNRGIGSGVIAKVAEYSRLQGKPLILTVSRINSNAVRLYERLGFLVTSESEMDLSMRREPNF